MPNAIPPTNVYTRRHLRFGWWSLLLFVTLGFLLELFHGFKIGWYLDVSNETRRLMWTLAHAHGGLLALLHILFGLSVRVMPEMISGRLNTISGSLIGASIGLPGGFFLGGVAFYSGDPGLGIIIAPIGGTLLMTAVFLIARATGIHTVASEHDNPTRPPRLSRRR